MILTLKDGNKMEFDNGLKALEIAGKISPRLAAAAVAAKVDGECVDLDTVIEKDCGFAVLTADDAEGLEIYRHTAAHILAQAVKNIYPTSNLGIGPAIGNGFYYDFDFKTPISKDDLEKIEKEMQKIIAADMPIVHRTVTRAEAVKIFTKFHEKYKLLLIEELPENEKITIYQQGQFIELCRGPHLSSTGKVKHFKLTNLTGAYWKGSEKNKMLTRIYGTAFDKKSSLDEYLAALEDAKLRDHNKLGRDLGYFTTDENVGQGLPIIMPKGAKVIQILQRFIEDEEERRGYQLTRTPIMSKNNLFKISGHWSHYRDGMFNLGEEPDEVLSLRPMTCPFQFLIYKSGLRSYRDLPIRYNETATLFRNESSGEMHGLIRIRQFTLSDGHIVCRPDQIKQEFKAAVDLLYYAMDALGLRGDVTYRFSKWDPEKTDKYIDNPEAWETTEALMREILNEIGLQYKEAAGEAAFYGPKLDIQFKNVHGKEDTLFTIQVDFALAERFDMTYVAEDGSKQRPFIIHRSSIGCYERTLALLIEKYAGALPVWLSPVQVRVLSLTDRTAGLADSIKDKLNSLKIRTESDNRNEKIGYKIREAANEKIPYVLVVGDKEKENGVVAVRGRAKGDMGTMTEDEFIALIQKEIQQKV